MAMQAGGRALDPLKAIRSRRRARASPGLALREVLVAIAIAAVAVWLLLPARDSAMRHGRRLACARKLLELHKGILAYQDASSGCLPLAWHVDGPTVADDLSNVAYWRFAIHERLDAAFSHVLAQHELQQTTNPLAARQQRFHLNSLFWKCPTKGWTDDYFAPETVFRKIGPPARRADLDAALPPTERPVLADVNASFPDPEASHLQDPGHNHELRNGFSMAAEGGLSVFIGVGACLRVAGHPTSSRLDFRHDRAVNVLFLDAHVDAVQPDDAARLEAIQGAWDRSGARPREK